MSSARDLSTASVSNSPTKIQKKPNPDTLECQLAIHPSEQFVEPHELMVPGSFVLFCSVYLFIGVKTQVSKNPIKKSKRINRDRMRFAA